MRSAFVLTSLLLIIPAAPAHAQAVHPDTTILSAFPWRSVGPANMSGRVSAVLGNPRNPKEILVGFASGGLWRTVNAGTTWTPVFDHEKVSTVSALAMAPGDTSVVWAGTGEADSRNSISPGGGVYRSGDAGKTWTFMGLAETRQIGRIVIDPADANVVYVAALGHAWGPNRERGLFKTTDGGHTWTNAKFISDRAGFVDVVMDPSNHNVLWAASWERQRTPYSLQSGGPGSGLWKTTDAGATWARISGGGFPSTALGRIGLAVAPSNPQVVYARIEADSNPNPESLRKGFVADTSKRQRLQSGLYRTTDGGATWTKMNSSNDRPFYFSQVGVDPKDADRVYWMDIGISFSNDGGRTPRSVGSGIHVDYHGFWVDPSDPDHYIVGEDGGLAVTYDRGRTYDAIMQMPVGQFYAITLDMQQPFWICGGLQDNGSWCGPSRTNRRAGILDQDWFNVGGGDGFYAGIDPTDPNTVYAESQGGSISRLDLRTWERKQIRPVTQPLSRLLEDSVLIARGDTAAPITPAAQRTVDAYKARITADSLNRPRFNWSTPFFVSPHNPGTLYLGGHRLYKSVDRGDHWSPISEDLSTRDSLRIKLSTRTSGGITRDITGAETHGTITTVAESPLRAGIIWAGTDDGNVWLTTSDGAAWTSLTGRFAGVPAKTWVTRVEPSHFDTATCYVTFDGHRDDNNHPYVFVTTDFGRTFRSLSASLPDDYFVHVIREDPRRRDLLFLGTEYAPFVSFDTGATWHRLDFAMPTVPVHDLAVHRRDRVLVAATHGRSIFTMDIGPLEELTDSMLAAPFHLFTVDPALLYNERTGQFWSGNKLFTVPNPGYGARIAYRLPGTGSPVVDTATARDSAGPEQGDPGEQDDARPAFAEEGPDQRRLRADTVQFVITGPLGDTVRTMRVSGGPGFHWVTWDLRKNRTPLGPAARRDSIAAAARSKVVRDSLAAAWKGDTTENGRRRAAGRDPEPDEPGTWEPPAGLRTGRGGGGGGGFGGLGGASLVDPGDYVLTVTVNGATYRRVIRVVRPSGPQSAVAGDWQ
jgi:photosystem II stability/assembly factor-like uncharacterized protein